MRLNQGDPLSLLLFVLVTDVLSSMFSHALTSKVLVGVPLSEFGSRCNLHYDVNLLILTMGGLEDLRIMKLILIIFEGVTGIQTNFTKTCLFSSRMGKLPEVEPTETLNCKVGLLPITNLGVSILVRWPHQQDWKGIILKVRKWLSSWKVHHLSLGGRLTLVNSVLSALPTYWMSIFRLSLWVIKEIDRIRRDFLWSGPDIDYSGCRHVFGKNLCPPRDQGGCGILDLYNFN